MPGRLAHGMAWLFERIVERRNRRYDRPGASVRAPIPVVSVGNLTVGGTGKTPLVEWCAARLIEAKRVPAVVSRGYRGSAGRGPVIVSAGQGPVVSARVSGDEPALLASRLPGAIVVVGSDRFAGVDAAAAKGADVAILDDGFQHRRLARDLDVVLIDRDDPIGGGALLPAGRLREPLASLSRADVIVVTRCGPEADAPVPERLARVLARHARDRPVFRAGHRSVGFVGQDGLAVDPPERCVAFCGIARPDGFRRELEHSGVVVEAFEAFDDHHPFSERDLARMGALATRHRCTWVATTEKDLARIDGRHALPGGARIVALRIVAHVRDGAALERRLLEAGRGRT